MHVEVRLDVLTLGFMLLQRAQIVVCTMLSADWVSLVVGGMLLLILTVVDGPMLVLNDRESLMNHILWVVRVVIRQICGFENRVLVERHGLNVMLVIVSVVKLWMEAWILPVVTNSMRQETFL